MSHLHELGWNSYFQQFLKTTDSRLPARVIEEQRSAFRLDCEVGADFQDHSPRGFHNHSPTPDVVSRFSNSV